MSDFCSYVIKPPSQTGANISILGINSAWLAYGGAEDYGKLLVGEPQVHEALKQSEGSDLRIALMHHPFACLKRSDQDVVERQLRDKCDFILLGHMHKCDVRFESTLAGRTFIIPAGAGFEGRDSQMNSYNYVHFDMDTGMGEVYMRYYNSLRDEWIPDTINAKAEYGGRIQIPTLMDDSTTVTPEPPSDPGKRPVPLLDREKFVGQVAKIYRVTGHKVQRDAVIDGGKIDISAALPIRLGRPDQITYIRCMHEATTEDVSDFNDVLSKSPRAVGMIVSQYEPKSDAMESARKHGIMVLTYDELVSQTINFSPYLEKCIKDYMREGVGQGVPLKRLYVEQDIIEDRTEKISTLSDYVQDWLGDDSQNLLVILGDFGTGKTSYTFKLASELAEKYKQENAGIIPIRIELKSYREALDYETMIVNHLSEFEVTTGYETIDFLIQEGKILLILDAFDEMAVQVNEEVTKENFDQLYKAVKGRAKVILTCRTHYFKENPEVESLIFDINAPKGFRTHEGTALYMAISGRGNCRICFLQLFDDKKVDRYLQKALGEEWETALQALNKTPGLKDLAHRPVLLAMITQNIQEISKKSVPSTVALYEVYIRKWTERDDARTNLTKAGKEKFAEELAGKLWMEGRDRIHYRELSPLVEQHFKMQIPLHLEYAEHEVRTASFLTRDEEGNYGFAHKSFMEFFLARKFVSEIERNEIIDFGKKIITKDVADFLTGMITDEGLLYDLIRNKTVAEVGYAGANVVSILKAMKGSLAGADFSNCVLSHADFSGLHSLAGVDFSGAYMDGIYLSLYGFLSLAFSPDKKYIAVGGGVVVGSGGGVVTILDSSNFSTVEVIETKYYVGNVTYTPDRKYIIVGGGIGAVAAVAGGGGVTILDSLDFSIVKEIETKYYVRHIIYSPDEKYIVIGSGCVIATGGGVTILDSSDFSIVKEIETDYYVEDVSYTLDKRHVVIGGGRGSGGGGATILDSSDFSIVKEMQTKYYVRHVTHSPDKRCILIGVGSLGALAGGITILNSSDFSIVKEIETEYFVEDVTYTLDKRHIVMGGGRGPGGSGVTILNSSDFSIVKEIETEYYVRHVIHSPDKRYIVVGAGSASGSKGGVTILNSSDFSIVKEIETEYYVRHVTYTLDEKYIVVGVGGDIGVVGGAVFSVVGVTILDAESFDLVEEITRVANDIKGMKIEGAKGLDPMLENALRRGI